MTRLLFGILFLISVSCLVVAQDDTTELVDFTIVNNTGTTICYVNIAPADGQSWGKDWLEDEVIAPGWKRSWKLDTGVYNIRLRDCRFNTLYQEIELNISDDTTINYSVGDGGSPNLGLFTALSNLISINNAERILQLADEGISLLMVDKPIEARKPLEEGLVLARESGEKYFEAMVLGLLGDTYEYVDEFETALEYYFETLDILEEIGEIDNQTYALTLQSIGYIYHLQEDYDLASYYTEQAMNILHQNDLQNMEVFALITTGNQHRLQDEYEAAHASFSEALVISRRIGETTSEATSLEQIANLYEAQGDFSQADKTYLEALAVWRSTDNQSAIASVLGKLGHLSESQGQSGRALKYYYEALDIYQKNENTFEEVSTLFDIGAVLFSLGRHHDALEIFDRALNDNNLFADPELGASYQRMMGLTYHSLGQYEKALEYYIQSLEAPTTINPQSSVVQSLQLIGHVYIDMGEYSLALEYLSQAYELQTVIGKPSDEALALMWIGLVEGKLGNENQALDLLNQALHISQDVDFEFGEGIASTLMGSLFFEKGEYELALESFANAYEAYSSRPSLAVAILIQRAGIYEALGQSQYALEEYKKATELAEKILNNASLDLSISSLLEQPEYNWSFRRLAVLLTQEGDIVDALNYAERGRAILVRTELTSNLIKFHNDLDESLLAQATEIRLKLISAQNLVDSLRRDSSATSSAITEAQLKVDSAHVEYTQHIERMQLQGGFVSREVSFEVTTIDGIQAVIPDNATLLIYSISSPNSVVFLITQNSLEAVILEATTDEIEEIVHTFAANRTGNTSVLNDLYDLIFAPIADQISTSYLIISSDGPLNYVPFAAMQSPDGRYLIDDYSISMIPSATVLALLNDRELVQPSSPGLVLAQPDAPGLPRLMYARSAALDIAEILTTDASIDATEAELRDNVAGNAILYISAHAELDPFAPLFSTIYLKEGGGYDGRLEVHEIYELDLSQGTELVILSGCETGSGSGEDFGMLNRAFFGAGARKVVASLWRVEDESTADLITAFIRERENYENDADALRAAMLAIKEKHHEPYYWASFVLTGMP